MQDLIIIGAGPAGLSASIYASRYGLPHEIIGSVPGGIVNEAAHVCNFPTELEIKGFELAQKIQAHAEHLLGEKIRIDTVIDLKKEKDHFTIQLQSGQKHQSKTILIATGTKRRHLDVPGEKEFLGKGVSYCATCDAMFFKNKIVAVIGGSDAANTAALTLAHVCKKVYIIYRRGQLRGETAWIEAVKKEPKITVIYNTNITTIKGSNTVEAVTLDKPYKNSTELAVDGVFIEIGAVPNTILFKNLAVKTTEEGLIIVNEKQQTSIPGIWAAGDCTTGSNRFRQVITACAEGAIAVFNIFQALKKA